MSIARVQSPGGAQNAAAATTIAAPVFVSNVTVGNAIVVGVAGGPVDHVSDNLGNVYALAHAAQDGTMFFYVASVTTGGSCTVTATYTASTTVRSIIVAEYSGVSTVHPVDVTVQTDSGSAPGGTITSPALNTNRDGDAIIAFATDGTRTITWGAGAGYALIATSSGTTGFTAMEDQIQAARGPITASFTGFTAGDAYDLLVMALMPPSTRHKAKTIQPSIAPSIALSIR